MKDKTKSEVVGGLIALLVLVFYWLGILKPERISYRTKAVVMMIIAVVAWTIWAFSRFLRDRLKEAAINEEISRRLENTKRQLLMWHRKSEAAEKLMSKEERSRRCSCGRPKETWAAECKWCIQDFYCKRVGRQYLELQKWTIRALQEGV